MDFEKYLKTGAVVLAGAVAGIVSGTLVSKMLKKAIGYPIAAIMVPAVLGFMILKGEKGVLFGVGGAVAIALGIAGKIVNDKLGGV